MVFKENQAEAVTKQDLVDFSKCEYPLITNSIDFDEFEKKIQENDPFVMQCFKKFKFIFKNKNKKAISLIIDFFNMFFAKVFWKQCSWIPIEDKIPFKQHILTITTIQNIIFEITSNMLTIDDIQLKVRSRIQQFYSFDPEIHPKQKKKKPEQSQKTKNHKHNLN